MSKILSDVNKYNKRWKMQTGIMQLCRRLKITTDEFWSEIFPKYTDEKRHKNMNEMTEEEMSNLMTDLAWSLYKR